VPHVPDECYTGGGFERKSADAVTLQIKKDNSQQQLGARYLIFGTTQSDVLAGGTTFPVLYTFSVNGEYAGGREDARLILNKNLFGRFSYFSKVEWKFYNSSFGRTVYPNKQDTLAASEKLLTAVLPILEKELWPGGLW
jgi:hypothetical protein